MGVSYASLGQSINSILVDSQIKLKKSKLTFLLGSNESHQFSNQLEVKIQCGGQLPDGPTRLELRLPLADAETALEQVNILKSKLDQIKTESNIRASAKNLLEKVTVSTQANEILFVAALDIPAAEAPLFAEDHLKIFASHRQFLAYRLGVNEVS